RSADERPGDADLLGERPGDDADALGPRLEERIALEHVLVFVESSLDQAHRVADLLVPVRWNVVPRTADLVEAVEQPRARQRLEQVEDPLPLANAVEEDGRAASQRASHVEAPRAEPEAVRCDPLQLRHDHAKVLRALGDLDLPDHLGGPYVRELAGHG